MGNKQIFVVIIISGKIVKDEGPIELQTANFDLKWSELSKSVVFATNENSTQLIQFTHDKHVINSLFTNHEIMLPHLHVNKSILFEYIHLQYYSS